jgi:hypothetical protein
MLLYRPILCAATLLVCAHLQADDPLSVRYERLRDGFVESLELLADKCEELEKTAEAQATRAWIRPRQSGRDLYFRTAVDLRAKSAQPALDARWRERFVALRREYAADLFQLAQDAAREKRGSLAIAMLYEALHEDPELNAARRVAGVDPTKPLRAAAESHAHADFGWPKGRHWSAESQHFRIESNESAAACLQLAAELEQLHQVWLQVFYSVWGSDDAVARAFAAGEPVLSAAKRFRVVSFKSRDEYLRQLSPGASNVAVSSGFYSDEQRTVFLVGGTEGKRSTRFHEVTHQLLQEYLQAKPGVGKGMGIALVEAVAIFMESLQIESDVAMLGGYDADNLQFARFRALGGDFQMPLAEMVRLSRSQLQEHKDIRKIYSELGGIGHFFMEGEGGQLRQPFLRTLVDVYRAKATAESLAERCETTYAQLDDRYVRFLNVSDEHVQRMPPHADLKALSLRRTSVTDEGLLAFARCDQLRWLDLSLTAAGDEGLSVFPASKALKQLFLERTRISDEALSGLSRFPELEELYLSQAKISDRGVEHLAKLKKLTTLDLAGCPVSDECIPALQQLKQLESLDLSATNFSEAGLAKLKKLLPKWKP